MSVNKIMILGNLGRDPELRFTQKQTPVCTLSVATTEKQKNHSGEWADHTEWHRVVVFGKQAENCSKYLQKGSQVFVEGKIRTNKWQDKNGVDRYTTEIWADNVRFVGSRNNRSDYPAEPPQQDEPLAPDKSVLDSIPSADELSSKNNESNAIQEDDIPF